MCLNPTFAVAIDHDNNTIKRKKINVDFNSCGLGDEFHDFIESCGETVRAVCVVRFHKKANREVTIDYRYNPRYKPVNMRV